MPVRLLLVLLAMLAILGAVVLLLEEDAAPAESLGLKPDLVEPRPETALPATELAVEPIADPVALVVEADVEEPQADGSLDAGGLVTGRVVDPTGEPLAGRPVLIQLTEDHWHETRNGGYDPLLLGRTTSDAEGAFSLPARPGARHTVLAGGVEWARVRLDHVVSGDELLVQLAEARWVEGVVQSEETGEPIAGAHVVAIGAYESLSVQTDEDGRYRIAPLPPEPAALGAWAPGYDVTYDSNVMPGWEAVTLELKDGRPIQGLAIDSDSQEPVPDMEVRLEMDLHARFLETDASGPPSTDTVLELTATTDELGEFRFDSGPSSGFVLHLTREGYVPREYTAYVDRMLDQEQTLEVKVKELRDVVGRVVDGPEGEEVPGVQLVLEQEGTQLAQQVSDGLGGFEFSLADWDGSSGLTVRARHADGRRGYERVRGRHRESGMELELVRPQPIEVLVVAGGEPLAGAQVLVTAVPGPGEMSLGRTDAAGVVSFVHPLHRSDVEALIVQARHLAGQSLPTRVELEEIVPGEAFVLDVETGVYLEGSVLDGYGQPVVGASVWERGAAVCRTDFAGAFRLGPFEEGSTARLRVSADGYREERQTIREVADWTGPVILTLEPIVLWEGRVVDAATGRPVENYLGHLQVEKTKRDKRVFVDTNAKVDRVPEELSRFKAELPGEGRYRLRVMALEYTETVSLAVDFDGATPPPPVEVRMSPAAVLAVTVLDSAGRPVEGLSVRVIDFEASEDRKLTNRARRNGPNARTDRNGYVRFNLGHGGSYRLTSGATGWLEERRLFVTPGPPVERTYRLPATGDLAVRVTDTQGAPAERPRVTVRAIGKKRPYELMRRSAPRGTPEQVLFESLTPGRYRVQVRARGLGSWTGETVVAANRIEYEDVVLEFPTEDAGNKPGKNAKDTSRNRGGGDGQRSR